MLDNQDEAPFEPACLPTKAGFVPVGTGQKIAEVFDYQWLTLKPLRTF